MIMMEVLYIGSLIEIVIVVELFNKICRIFSYGSIESIMQILNYQEKRPTFKYYRMFSHPQEA